MLLEEVYELIFFFFKTFVITTAIIIIIFSTVTALKIGKKRKKLYDIHIENLTEKFKDLRLTMLELVNPFLFTQEKKERKKNEKKYNKKLKSDKNEEKKASYVINFDGDITASQVHNFSKEIDAVLSVAGEKDEVVVCLNSGGGLVNGYGLGAMEMNRIKERKIPLTVCVDKIAASGGYLMACIADKLLAAPFSIIGSIGVVAQMPNFHRLLKNMNIDYEMHTSGKYKRTLTMFGNNTNEGREKMQEELENVHLLFKQFVSIHRPQIELAQVSTGEYWLGKQALDFKLVDANITSSQYIASKIANKETVFQIKNQQKVRPFKKFLTHFHSFTKNNFLSI